MSAPNLHEIEWAIHELKNQESSENNYALLAALCVCRDELMGKAAPQMSEYSLTTAPVAEPILDAPLGRYGDSDFLLTVAGKDPANAWEVMDEHMEALRIVNKRVYNDVMRKLRQL